MILSNKKCNACGSFYENQNNLYKYCAVCGMNKSITSNFSSCQRLPTKPANCRECGEKIHHSKSCSKYIELKEAETNFRSLGHWRG